MADPAAQNWISREKVQIQKHPEAAPTMNRGEISLDVHEFIQQDADDLRAFGELGMHPVNKELEWNEEEEASGTCGEATPARLQWAFWEKVVACESPYAPPNQNNTLPQDDYSQEVVQDVVLPVGLLLKEIIYPTSIPLIALRHAQGYSEASTVIEMIDA